MADHLIPTPALHRWVVDLFRAAGSNAREATLTGGETMQPANTGVRHAIWNNMLALVFDPARLGTGERFEQEARSFVDWVKSARPSAVGRELGGILMPGDPERGC